MHIFLWEENECDPGGADSSGRAPNTTLLVRPHTAHSVSSGRSGRSSLEIIKALISCQTPQRHPSITRTLKPPLLNVNKLRDANGRRTPFFFATLHSDNGVFGRIPSGSIRETCGLTLAAGAESKRIPGMLCRSCYPCQTPGSSRSSCVLQPMLRNEADDDQKGQRLKRKDVLESSSARGRGGTTTTRPTCTNAAREEFPTPTLVTGSESGGHAARRRPSGCQRLQLDTFQLPI